MHCSPLLVTSEILSLLAEHPGSLKRTPDPNHSLSSCHQPLCGTLERTKLVDRPGPHFPDPRLELAPTSPNPEQPGPGAQASSALLSPSPYSVLTWGGRLRGTHLPGVSRISKPARPSALTLPFLPLALQPQPSPHSALAQSSPESLRKPPRRLVTAQITPAAQSWPQLR